MGVLVAELAGIREGAVSCSWEGGAADGDFLMSEGGEAVMPRW